MAALHTLLRRASDLFRTSSGTPQQLKPPAADGEVVFCKNNVCVHPPVSSKNGVTHHPGYLTIKVHHDEVLGLSLRLSWIPNASLKKNPRSLENRTPCSSPCRSPSVCTSVCPSPTVHQRQFRRGSTSSGNQPALDEGSVCHLSCDQQSISSAVSDMGSPPEEQGSLDSWTASDQAEMTAVDGGITGRATPRPQRWRSLWCRHEAPLFPRCRAVRTRAYRVPTAMGHRRRPSDRRKSRLLWSP
ncbi:TBC1 domain family member 16 [Rhipicephalus sanguineus]|uniref:TBC1 domain family member 16 n=1 Tax=Rhipicephalus sanguineus TaxID=34632 RepID=UPI001894FE1B|nr:TBC1 domain family member 16 [Rhipicephalus sanguineus]